MTTDNRIALVTGANKGLGFETVRRLAELGWTVHLGSRDRERGEAALAELTGDVRLLDLDVTSNESVAAAAESLDRLDVLINNAGIAGNFAGFKDVAMTDFVSVYGVNVLGPVRMIQAMLPKLAKSDDPRVVNVSSGLGSFAVTSEPGRIESTMPSTVYPSSKAALNMISLQLSKELPWVDVCVVDPGYTATDLNGHTGPQTVEEGAEAIVVAAVGKAPGIFSDRHGVQGW